MTVRQIIYLLLRDPTLVVNKAWQRAQRLWRYQRSAWTALRQSRAEPSSTCADQSVNLPAVLADTVPLVLLEQRPGFARLGLRAEDVPRLFVRIAQTFPDASILFDGKAISSLNVALMRKGRKSESITVRIPHHRGGALLEFDLFESTGAPAYVSRTERNDIAGTFYENIFARSGVIDLPKRMPELVRRTNKMTIDIVYTWVNSKDPDWRRSFNEAIRVGRALMPLPMENSAQMRNFVTLSVRYDTFALGRYDPYRIKLRSTRLAGLPASTHPLGTPREAHGRRLFADL